MCSSDLPDWPEFDGTFKNYLTFRKDLNTFLKDYYSTTSENLIVMQIRKKCLKGNVVEMVRGCMTVQEIIETLDMTYQRPSRVIEVMMKPILATKKILAEDYGRMVEVYSMVKALCGEVKALNISDEIGRAHV